PPNSPRAVPVLTLVLARRAARRARVRASGPAGRPSYREGLVQPRPSRAGRRGGRARRPPPHAGERRARADDADAAREGARRPRLLGAAVRGQLRAGAPP